MNDNSNTNNDNLNNDNQITCPECENAFDYDTTVLAIGDIVECPICGVTLEVLDISPLTVEPIILGK